MYFIIFVTLFLFIQLTYTQSNFVYESSVQAGQFASPDEHGYRYCASWQLADGTSLYSTCDPFSYKRCGKTLDFKYDCCVGFKKIGPPIFPQNSFGNDVCAQTISQWDLCPKVLDDIPGVKSFAKMINSGEMINENPTEAFTIFAPELKDESELSKLFGSYGEGSSNPIFYHVVKGRVYPNNLKNNQELESVYQNQKLRVTKYSFGVVCIDCVEITKVGIECKNAVVHFIRKPLIARSGTSFDRKNIFDALKSDPQTSMFAADIPSSLQDELKNVQSKMFYTILAVKNDAWTSIKKKYSGDEIVAIIRNHIMPRLYCSSAIYKSKKNLKTLSGEDVMVECNTENNAEVRSITDSCGAQSKFISQDNMAENGVYHVLDNAVVPLSARSLKDIMSDPKCASSKTLEIGKYLDFIKDCDLRMEAGKKYTVLLPLDKSFDWWKGYAQFKPEHDKFLTDKEYRCRVARYHIMEYNPELDKIASLWHQQKGYKDNNKDLLHEVDYFLKDKDHSDLYFHFSPVVNFDSFKFRDGSFYRTSRINVIPEKFIVDVLKDHPNLKLTSSQVTKGDLDKTEFKPRRPLSLFLATLDDGLKNLTTGKVDKIVAGYEGKALKNYLLLHTVPLYLWGGDIGYFKPNTVHRFMSSVGMELIFWMDANGVMRIGYEGLPKDKWAEVVQWNLHAKDGIVWLLKRWITCPPKLCPHKVSIIDYDLFNVYVSACQIMELPGLSTPEIAKKEFNNKPIIIAQANPDKCSIFQQPTYKVSKKITPK